MKPVVPNKRPLFVGITGGTSAGKSVFAKTLQRNLGNPDTEIISQDNYYYCRGYLPLKERSKLNYDHPSSVDLSLLKKHLDCLTQREGIQCPLYDFKTHTRKNSFVWIRPSPIIIIEGTLILWDEGLRKIFDYTIFMDIPEDIRLLRRLNRDMEERGRSFVEVRNQYLDTVRPMHIRFIDPCKIYANLIIRDEDSRLQVNEIAERIRKMVSGI